MYTPPTYVLVQHGSPPVKCESILQILHVSNCHGPSRMDHLQCMEGGILCEQPGLQVHICTCTSIKLGTILL